MENQLVLGSLNPPSMSVFIPAPVGLTPLPMPPKTPLEGVVEYGVVVVGVVLTGLVFGLVVEGVVVDGFVVTGVGVVVLVPAALYKPKEELVNKPLNLNIP